MKKFLLIFLISGFTSSFCQTKIDTSDVKSIRYEWEIDLKKNDSTLNQILTEYGSGIYKEEFKNFTDNNHKFPFINLFESDFYYSGKDFKLTKKIYYFSALNGESKYFYDRHGNIDSIYQSYFKDTLTEWKYKIKKKYRKNGKLDFLINKSDEKEVYTYNLFGHLKTIELYKDSTLYEISTYKKGLLIDVFYPTREKYRKYFTYDYDNKGRITKRDDSDYDLYLYEYNEFGLSKIDKIFKSKNRIVESTIFSYNKDGLLKSRKEYRISKNKKILTNEYHYTYK